MNIALVILGTFLIMWSTGILKFGEPPPGDRTPIRWFKIDNMYSLHILGVGGFTFITWFAIIFVDKTGDTCSRLYGWENPHPKLDPPPSKSV